MNNRKQGVYDLLKGIETGDPAAVKVVNENRYIQHNPQTHEGGEGLAQLFARLAQTNPKVELVRLFEDGDYVFAHTIYDFSSVRVGFEVFRYEGAQIVEHWDNIQPRVGDMVGGETRADEHHLTESNRQRVTEFIEAAFVDKRIAADDCLSSDSFCEHSTSMGIAEKARRAEYVNLHRVLVEGNFVLAVSEGRLEGKHSAFYDLFRLKNAKIEEHWDTTEAIPPIEEWKNTNGKF